MIFEEDVDYFGNHIYVNIGSKQVIAVYLGYYDQEQSWIAVVVKHPCNENDISFKKILIYNSLIESVVPDDVKNSDIITQHRYAASYDWIHKDNPMVHMFMNGDYVRFVSEQYGDDELYAVYKGYECGYCHYMTHTFSYVFNKNGEYQNIENLIDDGNIDLIEVIYDSRLCKKIDNWICKYEKEKTEKAEAEENEKKEVICSVSYQSFVESFRTMTTIQRNAVIDDLNRINKEEDFSNKSVKLIKTSLTIPDLIV